jgi:cytochrome c biogenesis protein CcdA
LVFAATAEAMAQGILYIALYMFGLILPIPYCFLLAIYSLFWLNHSTEIRKELTIISKITLVFVALFVLVVFVLKIISTPNIWEVIVGADVVAGILIVVLGFNLIKLGKKIVLFAMLPLSIILVILSLGVYISI